MKHTSFEMLASGKTRSGGLGAINWNGFMVYAHTNSYIYIEPICPRHVRATVLSNVKHGLYCPRFAIGHCCPVSSKDSTVHAMRQDTDVQCRARTLLSTLCDRTLLSSVEQGLYCPRYATGHCCPVSSKDSTVHAMQQDTAVQCRARTLLSTLCDRTLMSTREDSHVRDADGRCCPNREGIARISS